MVDGRTYEKLHRRRRNLIRRPPGARLWAMLRTLVSFTALIAGCAFIPLACYLRT